MISMNTGSKYVAIIAMLPSQDCVMYLVPVRYSSYTIHKSDRITDSHTSTFQLLIKSKAHKTVCVPEVAEKALYLSFTFVSRTATGNRFDIWTRP